MTTLSVCGLTKRYPAFALEDVSFDLQPGTITGFIGRNGAGKSTTLKSLLNMVHPDQGTVSFWGMDFSSHEEEIKGRIGFVAGGVNYYPKKKLRTITAVTRRFYPQWDQEAYETYCRRFSLDENKTPSQLSAGMQVKYALALALSHRARLLILDEPTSGLDPVSREELLETFLTLAQDEGVTILFSTHITSDLEKCADRILYIHQGRIRADEDIRAFEGGYELLQLSPDQRRVLEPQLLGVRRSREGFTALVVREAALPADVERRPATLEEIFVHLEQEGME